MKKQHVFKRQKYVCKCGEEIVWESDSALPKTTICHCGGIAKMPPDCTGSTERGSKKRSNP
jgi:hypothetical protein